MTKEKLDRAFELECRINDLVLGEKNDSERRNRFIEFIEKGNGCSYIEGFQLDSKKLKLFLEENHIQSSKIIETLKKEFDEL